MARSRSMLGAIAIIVIAIVVYMAYAGSFSGGTTPSTDTAFSSASSEDWATDGEYASSESSVIASAGSSSSEEAASSEAVSSVAQSSAAMNDSFSSVIPGLNASKTVVTFFQWWIDYRGSPLADKAFESNPYITDKFKAALRTAADNGVIFCNPKKPPAFAVSSAVQGSADATAIVQEDYQDADVAVKVSLVRQGDLWKIDGIECPATGGSSSL